MENSRFSRFKFTPRPPPPPPKDDIYQRPNPSVRSLALPQAIDPPASPLSPTAQYALRRANSPSPSPFSALENNHVAPMNYSTPSLLSPSSVEGAGTRQTTLSTASKKDKALAFLKFPKRSPRTPPAVPAGMSSSAPASSVLVIGNPVNGLEDDLPPPPQEDAGISMPWNFQHNIHVDEGYIGLPPSWSTSLASAGFTEEEIAAIQARRAAGVRSPPDMRYLYNERPQSPATAAFAQAVPVLTHPLPRSTSLHRLAPSAAANLNANPADADSSPRPTLPSINTSSSDTANSTVGSSNSTPLSMRKPPPRRKPPSPREEDLEEERRKAHKAGQASQSTMAHSEEYSGSSSNHSTMDNTNTTFSGLNNSVAYKYNPGDTTYTSIGNPPYTQGGGYGTDIDDTDDDTPLARAPLRLGSESAVSAVSTVNATGGAGGGSRFKVMNGDSGPGERGRPKVPLPVGASNASMDALGLDVELDVGARPSAPAPNGKEKEKKGSPWGVKLARSKSREGMSEKDPAVHSVSVSASASASTSASTSTSTSNQMIPPAATSTWKTSTSTSFASVVKQGNTLVDAVKGGVAALRSSASGSSKDGMASGLKSTRAKLAASFRNRRNAASAEGGDEGAADDDDSDEEFASLPPEGEEQHGPPVWEIYRRPRAGTDASAGRSAGPSAAASTESLSGGGVKRSVSLRQGGALNKALDPLRRKASNKSQLSTQSTPSLLHSLKASRSGSSLRSGSGGKGSTHHKSGSMTSLESIPEAGSPPPMPSGAAAKASAGNVGAGSLLGKKAPALPPRLSLHQYTDSSDLASWSEALLSGISLSAAGKDGGFGLDLDFSDFSRDKSETKPAVHTPATATNGGGLTARPKVAATSSFQTSLSQSSTQQQQQQQPAVSVTPPQRLGITRKAGQPLPNSKPPPQRPIPPIAIAPLPLPPHPYANPALVGRGGAGSSNASSASGSMRGRSRSNSRACDRAEPQDISHAQSEWNDSPDSPAPHTGVAEPSNTARFMPTPSAPFTVPATTPSGANTNKPLPPLVPSAEPAHRAPAPQASTSVTADGLLSPPPTAWSTAANGVRSPAGSSVGPDSAQLWSEIEQMMDPAMMSSVPGLHLSTLPAGAQGVLRSAGLPTSHHAHPPSPPPLLPVGPSAEMAGVSLVSPQTVGDLVGTSPTYSAAINEIFSPTLPFTPEEERMEGQRRLRAAEGVLGTKDDNARGRMDREEDEDEDSEDSDYGDDPYDGVEALQIRRTGQGLRVREPVAERDDSGRLLTVSSHSRERGHDLSVRDTNRDSSRSSSSTLTVTALAATTIVRHASIARRAGAYVIHSERSPTVGSSHDARHPPSPLSSHFGGTGSEESGSGDSVSLSSQEQERELQSTPTTTDGGIASPLLYYLDGALTPSPTPDKMAFGARDHMPSIQSHSHGNSKDDEYDQPFEGYPDEETMEAEAAAAAAAATNMTRPTIIIGDVPLADGMILPTASMSTPGTATPLSPYQQYRGWLSDVVAPLAEFIDDAVEPREHYLDLNEIAEGESGSVFAAVLNPATAPKLRLPPLIKAKDADEIMADRTVLVAIKSVAIVPSGSPKLVDLHRELVLMRGLGHDNILSMDGVYVDLKEDSLWVRMELMERSLADIIGLVGEGLQLQERTIARFTSDILLALEYLRSHNIAHRDVRSDNLLLNKHGVLKLADFSNAVQVTREEPMRSDVVGVAFWQAPEVRRPPYNALKVDVWSLGATVWEMAQQDPPFADTQQLADRWPPLRQPELFSPPFHDFLRKCSEPAASRPDPSDLLKHSLIVHKACGRQVIVLLLSQCMAIEKLLQEGDVES